MPDLYVYYRVPRAALPAAVDAARRVQAGIAARWPGLRMGLAQRVDEPGASGEATLMETYLGAPDADALLVALPSGPGRHAEVFAPCA